MIYKRMLYHRGKRLHRWADLKRRGILIGFVTLMVLTVGIHGGLIWSRQGRPVLAELLRSTRKFMPSAKGHILADSTGSSHRPANTAAAVLTSGTKPQLPTQAGAVDCGSVPAVHTGLTNATNPELHKLAEYEQVCNGAVAAKASFFVPTPSTVGQATQYAQDVVVNLREFAQVGVAPLVFLEPNDENGVLDLEAYKAGQYDAGLDAYFAAIKQAGITDAMMGTWVMFPEGNIPGWGSVNPDTYATNVTKTIQFQKKYFPGSQSSIMLDSETYPSASSWSNGAYVSLLPYINPIPKGLVNSFGLQGFPWTPPKGQTGAVLDPHIYLQVGLAAEAAHALGVTQVWLNTGTFSRAYAQNAAQTVSISGTTRQTMLHGVIAQANVLRQQGFSVAVHLFAQNKANTTEAIDWSYWAESPSTGADTPVFKAFAHDASASHLAIWLFDATGN